MADSSRSRVFRAASSGGFWQQPFVALPVVGLTIIVAALLFLNSIGHPGGASPLFSVKASNLMRSGTETFDGKVQLLKAARYGSLMGSGVQPPGASAAAPGEGQLSDFGRVVQWDTPLVDKYGDQYLAMCLTIKNQHEDIREWVAHHKAVGAGKMYIYDTGSQPPLSEVLQDHVTSGLVHYIWHNYSAVDQTAKRPLQTDLYQDCLERFGRRHQFLGFLDSDEFIILEGGTPSVPALLRRMMAFEPIGGLVVNWRVFGSSGLVERPKGGVLRNYNKCHPLKDADTIHVKSFVNTDLADHPGKDPHHWMYKPGFHAVNEHFLRVDGPRNEHVTTDKIVIHHYVLKSLEDYKLKMERGSAMGNHKPLSFFESMDRLDTETCNQAMHMGPYS